MSPRVDPFDVMSLVLCLSAAIAVKRGGRTDLTSVQFATPDGLPETLPAELQDLFRKVHDDAVDRFHRASPWELDGAIALYTRELRHRGYNVEAGIPS